MTQRWSANSIGNWAGRQEIQPSQTSDWSPVRCREMKRKSMTLLLLRQEYRVAHPDGYSYDWFCDKFGAHDERTHPTYRHRHAAGAVMQTDYRRPDDPFGRP